MAGIPYSATLSFAGSAIGFVIGVSVETPTAEVVDMTSHTDPANKIVLVPTGSFTGGAITVDYLANSVPSSELGTVGNITFTSSAVSFTRRGILESASVEARTGELVRGTLRFRLTDYTGN